MRLFLTRTLSYKTCMPFRQALLSILLISIVITLPFLGNDFSSKGEPREALAAQYIYDTGNWILPFRYGDEFATKPPLLHWLIAITSYLTDGVTEISARLPASLLSIIGIVLFFLFLSKFCSNGLALLSSVICVSNIEWYRTAISARVDMPFSIFLLITFLSFYLAWQSNFKSNFYYSTCILSLTLASLTKGPVAIALPGLIFSIFLCREKFKLNLLIRILLPLALIPSLILGCWYMAAYQIGGDTFLDVVINENFRRLTGNMQADLGGAHAHSPFYLYGTLLSGFLPWTFLLFSPFWKYIPWKNLRYPKIFLQNQKISSLNFYFLIISAVFILFFSIPESKRSVYLLPAYPFISYFLAIYCQRITTHFPKYSEKFTLISAGIILIIIGSVFILISGLDLSNALIPILPNLNYFLSEIREFIERNISLFLILTAIPLILSLSAIKNRQISTLVTLWISTLCFFDFAVLHGLASALSAKPFAAEIINLGINCQSVRSFDRDYGLNFYLNGKLQEFSPEDCQKNDPLYLLIKKDALAENPQQIKDCSSGKIIHETTRAVEKINNKYLILRLNK